MQTTHYRRCPNDHHNRQDPGLHRAGNPCRLWHRIRRPGPQPETLGPAPVTVRYGDLNLASQEGARVLYGRISTAARKVCGPSFGLWYPGVATAWKHCYQATVDHAVRQVNSPALTELYEKGINVAAR